MAKSNGIFNGVAVTAISEYSSPDHAATHLIDGILTGVQYHSAAGGCPNGWVKFDLGEGNAKKAKEYFITTWDDNVAYNKFSWKDFTLQGSNNDSSYDTLDTRTGIVWTNGETKIFTFDSVIAYRYYKFVITKNQGNNAEGYICAAEIGMTQADQSPACYLHSCMDRMNLDGVSTQNRFAT